MADSYLWIDFRSLSRAYCVSCIKLPFAHSPGAADNSRSPDKTVYSLVASRSHRILPTVVAAVVVVHKRCLNFHNRLGYIIIRRNV